MNQIVGIDLGTTNSEIAIIKEGRPFVIADSEGSKIVPSFVGTSLTGEILVGELAQNQYIIAPENTIKSIKRKMGTDQKVEMGGDSYTPQEISALILKHLKVMAEGYLGEKVEKAVITVPAYFTDKQRQATKDAGEIAGLDVVRIINEPTAAALVYGSNREEDQNIIVYDLGGGTFDVSVIEINSGVIEVRSTRGDAQLGGDDFDHALVEYLADEFNKQHQIDLREDRKALARLNRAAEKAKVRLSNEPFALIDEEFLATKDDAPLHLKVEVERSLFESLIQEKIQSTIECVQEALQEASLTMEDIDRIILAGGSTRIPLISDMIEDNFGIAPRSEIDPDLCVAMGASVQAGIVAGEDIDTVLVDVTPHSLGIEVADWLIDRPILDQYSVIIRRNTAIPVTKSEVYTTFSPDQEQASIRVYQGEEPIASHNTFLGEFLLEKVERTKKGRPEIVVNFDYDINGIVHISARDKKTGKKKQITVAACAETLSDEQKEQATERIAHTEFYQEEVSVQAMTALLERANKVCQTLKNEEAKIELQELISEINQIMQTEEQQRLGELQEVLLDLLYDLEDEDGDDEDDYNDEEVQNTGSPEDGNHSGSNS